MRISEIIEEQKKFDSKYKSKFNWDQKITEENIDALQFLMLSMVGEFGETANIIKKVIRGDYKLNQVKEELSEEIIDIFIYVTKLIYQMDINFEEVYNKKMKKNEKKFQKYEKE